YQSNFYDETVKVQTTNNILMIPHIVAPTNHQITGFVTLCFSSKFCSCSIAKAILFYILFFIDISTINPTTVKLVITQNKKVTFKPHLSSYIFLKISTCTQ